MIYDLVASFKAVKRKVNVGDGNLLSFLLRCGTRPYERGTQSDSKVNVGDAWFRVSPLTFCLCLSELEFWSAGVVCLLLIWLRC